jgi:uncharacterized membrane protein (DUF485 family)
VARKRGFENSLDMLRSLGLLAVFISFILIVTWRPWMSTSINTVDYAGIAVRAENFVGFDVVVPALPDDWKVNNAHYDKAKDDASKYVWTISAVAPGEKFVSIQQTNTVLVEQFLKNVTGIDATWTPAAEWQSMPNSDGKNITYVFTREDSLVLFTLPLGNQELKDQLKELLAQ